MVDINYLEDERKKLWEKVVEQDKQIEDLKKIITTNIKAISDEIKAVTLQLFIKTEQKTEKMKLTDSLLL